jgi:putative transposase
LLDGFAQANRLAGGEGVKPAAALAFTPSRPVTEPFDTVEFDAHKLDLRLKILDQDPEGEEHVLEIERVWLLAVIDVGSRAILGYTLCLRREYGRYDAIRTFEKALTSMSLPTITIGDLEPMQSGGFVSTALPETAYACWRIIRFDNARAHLAADSLDVACELLGCTVDAGPAYDPNDRPFIERFFGTVAERFIHRLPGTTGSNSADTLRKLRDVRGDLRMILSFEELRELLAVWVWNYNGSPHGGLAGGRTPLEAIRLAVRDRQIMLRHVPQELRGNLCLLQSVHLARVRGNVQRGDKPHISFYHIRYTSHRLAQSPQLIGQSLRVFYDADDIRVLRAYLADGTELGELKAGGLWLVTPHSLEMRKRIFKVKRLRQLRFGDSDDPVQAYLNYKRGQSKRSRKAASEIAQIKERIQADQLKNPPPPAPITPDPLPFLATGPVKAKRLRIAPGYV